MGEAFGTRLDETFLKMCSNGQQHATRTFVMADRQDQNLHCAGRWSGRYVILVEVALIFLVFFVHAGWPVPDVNEAHYLGKARHYWNPAWASGDFFLESADAHLAFYWTFGWVLRWLPLVTAAWVGRIVTWGLLAWAWQRLSRAVVPRPLFSVLSAALFVCLLDRFHFAGEWVVGGVEAKGFAYVLVFLGLESLILNRWNRVWLLMGAAAAFHVIVGGWAVVLASLAWLESGEDRFPLRKSSGGLPEDWCFRFQGFCLHSTSPGTSLRRWSTERIRSMSSSVCPITWLRT